MAQPVWVLSVDLQTKTATFQSGMAGAAKSARGAFTEIKSGASEMGGHVSTNMFASRHAIMAASEAFGDTMPRAITALLVHIGPLGAALEAAFPFAAIGLAAVLLFQHLSKLKEEGIQLTLNQERFMTVTNNAFNSLDEKLLQSQIRADELRNNHLGALSKQLELIDKQSMAELVHSFGEVAKAADVVFKGLESHWYAAGIGSAGAKNALEQFQAQYESLLSQGKDKEASDLLRGTRESAEHVLALQKQIRSLEGKNGPVDVTKGGNDYAALAAARTELAKSGAGATEKEFQAQQALVGALTAQLGIEERVAAIKKQDGSNAKTTVGNEAAAKAAEGARQAAEHTIKMGELRLAAEREQATVSQTIHQGSIADRLAADIELADKEYAIQEQGNAALIAALDKSGKDYNNQLAALQNKAAELTAQHENAVAILKGKAQIEQYRLDLQNLEASEREKIDATEQGSAARLAAIDAAIKAEDALNLQDTAHYRELLSQRVQAAREAASEAAKQTAEGGRLEADNTIKMGELALAAARQHQALMDSSHSVSTRLRMQLEIEAANQEYAMKLTAMSMEIAALDKHGKDYENKLRELQNKQKQLVQQHENEITAIKEKAEIERNQKILSAEQQYTGEMANSLTQVLMGQKSFASAMESLGNQVVAGLMQQAIKHIEMNMLTKQSDAAAAARKGFNAGLQFPFPANLVMGPVLGAAMYSSVMAFEEGGIVPGVGRGDVVPAMLTPGEGVVPRGVMEGLSNMARSGNMGGGPHYQAHATFAPEIHAVDAAGVDRVLTKHARVFHQHVENTLRKMNKG